MNMTVNPTNGAKPQPTVWKQKTVQQFFSAVNWDDHPPAVQELKRIALQQFNQPISTQPLSLTLKVSDFFAAINWDDSAIAALPEGLLPPAADVDAFTLDEFSDLF